LRRESQPPLPVLEDDRPGPGTDCGGLTHTGGLNSLGTHRAIGEQPTEQHPIAAQTESQSLKTVPRLERLAVIARHVVGELGPAVRAEDDAFPAGQLNQNARHGPSMTPWWLVLRETRVPSWTLDRAHLPLRIRSVSAGNV
jgi:hypothetical protein